VSSSVAKASMRAMRSSRESEFPKLKGKSAAVKRFITRKWGSGGAAQGLKMVRAAGLEPARE
jgi:hypothetical protein